METILTRFHADWQHSTTYTDIHSSSGIMSSQGVQVAWFNLLRFCNAALCHLTFFAVPLLAAPCTYNTYLLTYTSMQQ